MSKPLRTVVTVIAVADGAQMDCCDTDTAHVWVRVTAWSPRRAFLTGAAPFVEVSGKASADLAGLRFFADLDLDNPPGNTDTSAERLEWPGLGLCPPLPWERTDGVAPAEADAETAALTFIDGRDALAFVIVRPGPTDGGVAIEAASKGLSKQEAASVLRHVAGLWEKEGGQ
ncbi:hypothetical protein OG272_16205 [Streptomyces sp. NBC_00104]|uniref:hypothetical protein n=1 Tax=Streptomyces sp. NBC_00104 TaxID=2903621 RepID=UPI0032555F75